ncbi:MAG: SDR family oxidoreductase [Xanthobacteraceae bacterium]
MPDEARLKNRTAIVTGAGRGIGRATAIKLAHEGADLLLNDLDSEPLEELAHELAVRGTRVHTFVGDVTAADFGDSIVAGANETFGGLDIVVANAGYGWNGRLESQTDEQWSVMIDTHATSAFRLARAMMRVPDDARRGAANHHRKIVLVSSIAAAHGAPQMASYAAAKGAVIGLTRSLAQELAGRAVNVNAVAFGLTETRLTREIESGESSTVVVSDRAQKLGYRSDLKMQTVARIPLGRTATVEEAAGAIWFLCIPESDYVTGQLLICSGGLYV